MNVSLPSLDWRQEGRIFAILVAGLHHRLGVARRLTEPPGRTGGGRLRAAQVVHERARGAAKRLVTAVDERYRDRSPAAKRGTLR